MSYKLTTSIVTAAMALTACAVGPADQKLIKSQVDTVKKEAQDRIVERTQSTLNGPVTYSDASWIPLRKVAKTQREVEKSKIDSIEIEINKNFSNLNDIAGSITAITGAPVFIDADTYAKTDGGQNSSGASNTNAATASTQQSQKPGQAAVPSGAITPSSPFNVNYSGSLTGFMNLITAYYGLSWKPEGPGIRVHMMESRTFRISALPGDTRLVAGVDSTSSTSAGSTGSTQSGASSNATAVSFSGLSVWSALETSIKQMLSPSGKVVASPATGTISVTDTPRILSMVSEFIAEQNRSLNRQVSVNVRVLSVTISDADNYGINWDAVYSNLSATNNPFSVAVKTAFTAATGAGTMTITSPTTSTSQWAGSSAIINALSEQGRVSELTSATLVTLNNQPAPVNVGKRTAYLASSTSTVSNGTTTTTLTPGTVQTGFSMTVVPNIIDGRELLLQYSLDLSALVSMLSISSGTSSIQVPDVSTSNFIQRVRMQSGETLVVGGFDKDNLSAVSQGIGSAENAAAGSRKGSTTRTMLVVLIQPNLSLL